jgi:hypothetical protein
MTIPYALSASTKYSIVVRAPSGTAANKIDWRMDGTPAGYSGGGFMTSINSGASWTAEDATNDLLFKTWATGYTTVTATGLTDSDHVLMIGHSGTALSVYWDGALKDSEASAVAIPANSTGVTWIQNGVMPYMEYIKVHKANVLVAHITWQNAAIFTDLSGNGNDATPTFPGALTDADVTAELLSFEPIEQAQASTSATAAGQLLTAVPPQPAGMYTPTGDIGLFFAPAVNALLDIGHIPQPFFWYSFAFLIIYASGFLTFKFVKSVLIKALVMSSMILFFAVVNIHGIFPMIYFACDAFGIVILAKHFSW